MPQKCSHVELGDITPLHPRDELDGGKPPLLFLLDELLQGTNLKDRLIGAEGMLRALLDHGAIGLVSTHDLALAEIDIPPNFQLHNVHFQEEFEKQENALRLYPARGVVTKSNGLELMRAIGLDV
jgi:DNA mismatch repair ATPase MutS